MTKYFKISQIPRIENSRADALARSASNDTVGVEPSAIPSIRRLMVTTIEEVTTGIIVVWVFTLRFESDLKIAPCSGSLLDFGAGISFYCRGAVATRGQVAYYDVYLPLYGAFRTERWLARLSYKPIEVVMMYEVFDLILQVVALLGVMSVVAMEVVVALASCSSAQVLIRLGVFRSHFSRIWRKISVRIELSGMLGSRGTAYTALSILFLWSPSSGPQEDSARSRF
ncbi:hypothetical protein B296_00013111 [Ensete ventricosum]|uniref:Uncharacterized protein n=1 Tax=Ensete ventricosum TaxID=4639 RepID=A0A426Z6U3_ENSVE|nr:hypothetical protein B296_00013111 [Ensete ventricosum]